ncbi:threonine/serine exporter family protein [Salipaludibacillus agaradhaerens]|uniref:Threonine/serine exporter family protein n=1 Tax=Salipaludibacillus agaradhaerens TaxID=76935 RepID=A0A9Q4B4R1_SALAG|nr:threonine/serine exporter family protein [Salipaludibacillus agaradhaerens]MCR6098393.1 threonine/serine exporter family protein [Salipaludibacillus agaradhaerens]MCR6115977.1 threonine/serine exporter family protein [Salipaludibacillus agaradhaerens]
MELLLELVITFAAVIGFGIIFSVPKRALLLGGGIGVITWFVLQTGIAFGASSVFSTLLASLSAATIAHLLAKKIRIPVTTLSIPGILPLVPGSRAYFTMLSFVEGEYIQGLEYGVETMLQAGAIAGGLVLALSIFSFGKGIGNRYEAGH